jgi:hypothetical protein
MKVFNITDASTHALRNQGLEGQHIRVGDVVIAPGSSAVIRGTAREVSELVPLTKVGAVALDQLPVWYAAKRGLSLSGEPLTPVVPTKAEPAEATDEWDKE